MTADDDVELQLLEAAVAGHRAAFDRLFAMQVGWLSRRAEGLLRGQEGRISCGAADLVQEAGARVWKKMPEFKLPSSRDERLPAFRQFLIVTMTRYFTDQITSGHVIYLTLESRLFGPDDVGLDGQRANPAPTPRRAAGAAEAAYQIKKCLGTLSERHRDILVFHEVDGLSYEEIATRTGETKGAIQGVLRSARAQMKECMIRSSLWEIPGRG